MRKAFTVGIDEAGRGPIAGPVSVAAFTPRRNFQVSISNFQKASRLPLRDSKKLTALQREKWFAIIRTWQREGKCDFAVSMVSAQMIDTIGISKAIKKALANSLSKLEAKSSQLILLDGGLKAPENFKNQKTIIKGDEKEQVIALASICAKVLRDRRMVRYAKIFPEYFFDVHKGYGTSRHYQSLQKHGLSPIHRRSFLRNLA